MHKYSLDGAVFFVKAKQFSDTQIIEQFRYKVLPEQRDKPIAG